MTSSFVISKLDSALANKQDAYSSIWNLPYFPGQTIGGLEDGHIRIFGECHPDYRAIPIGKPGGAKYCVKRVDNCTAQNPIPVKEIALRPGDKFYKKTERESKNPERTGFHRVSVNLYDERKREPVQEWNPQYYSSRRTPYEQDLIRRDYWRPPVYFNGTGMRLYHNPPPIVANPPVPANKVSGDPGPYPQYFYSFTPNEDIATGDRTATSLADNRPEYKYDITRLDQPYPMWKEEQRYMGVNQDAYDSQYFTRIV